MVCSRPHERYLAVLSVLSCEKEIFKENTITGMINIILYECFSISKSLVRINSNYEIKVSQQLRIIREENLLNKLLFFISFIYIV